MRRSATAEDHAAQPVGVPEAQRRCGGAVAEPAREEGAPGGRFLVLHAHRRVVPDAPAAVLERETRSTSSPCDSRGSTLPDPLAPHEQGGGGT